MLKTILSISGKPGLYKLVSRGKNMLIVESVADKKRFPAYGNEKIISLGDIAMYTDAEDIPLSQVLTSMKKKENGALVTLDVKKASANELGAYLAEVLPNYDRDRVHVSDIKKLISWYNLLVKNGYLGCCMAFRKEVLDAALPFPSCIPMHDIWIGNVAAFRFSVSFIGKAMVFFRRHGEANSSTARKSDAPLWSKIRFRLNVCRGLFHMKKGKMI